MTQTELGLLVYAALGVLMLAIIIKGIIKDIKGERY